MGRLRASTRQRQRGVTLIELMVALLIAMLLSVAILFVQRNLAQHNSRTADIALRDNEARAAMDLIVHDLSGAGFLFGGSQLPCDALFTYNSANTAGSPAGYYIRFPVDAIAGTVGAQMPFAPALTLNYPSAAQATAGLASDVLVITGATGTANFGDALSPLINVAPNPAYPLTDGLLPLVSNVGVSAPTANVSRAAVLQVPDNGKRACMRVPVVAVGSQSNSFNISSSGDPRMPLTFYAGFATQMVPAGLTGPLTNAEIFQARLVDLGPQPTTSPATLPAHTSTAFYIQGGTGNTGWPTLMRATYSLIDDSLVDGPRPIAAGVVSLQVLFGIDPGDTGAVTDYQTGAYIRTNRLQSAVLSMRVALVTRALYADPSFANPAASVPVGTRFADVPIPADKLNYRYVVHQTEVALRNCQWQRC